MAKDEFTMYDYVVMANTRMSENLDHAQSLVDPLVARYLADGEAAKPVRIIASGSSRHGALCAVDFMQETLGVPVWVVTPERYSSFDAKVPVNSFDVVVSQSGYSTNALRALDVLRAEGNPAIALTACVDAPVSKHADAVLDYGVGLESVDFVTMGVQCLVEYLMLFAVFAAKARGSLDAVGSARTLAGIDDAVHAHANALEVSKRFVDRAALELSRRDPCVFVGNGPNYGVALEAALKFQETLKVASMTFEGEEFIHGPEMQVAPGYRVFIIDDPFGSDRLRASAEAMAHVTQSAWFVTSCPMGRPYEIAMPSVADGMCCALPNLALFQTTSSQMSARLDSWNIHPLLAECEGGLDSKADGYEAAQQALRDRASCLYGDHTTERP